MIKSALKPNYFNPIRELSTLKSELEASKTGVDKDDQFLYNLQTTKGWEVLDEFIEGIKKDLNDRIKSQMEQGVSFEIIGQTTVMVQLCNEVLTRIQDKVSDAVESVETKNE